MQPSRERARGETKTVRQSGLISRNGIHQFSLLRPSLCACERVCELTLPAFFAIKAAMFGLVSKLTVNRLSVCVSEWLSKSS